MSGTVEVLKQHVMQNQPRVLAKPDDLRNMLKDHSSSSNFKLRPSSSAVSHKQWLRQMLERRLSRF
jgi:hypothetical protein